MSHEKIDEHLGRLVSISNWLHNTLVIAISKYLNLSPAIGEIAFASRSSGDLNETLRAIIKNMEESGTKLGCLEICGKLGGLNKLLSRTKHVHGQITYETQYRAKKITDRSLSFSMRSVSGGKFSRSELKYDSVSEFGEALERARNTLLELHEMMGITEDDWRRYLNIGEKYSELSRPLSDQYDPPRTFHED